MDFQQVIGHIKAVLFNIRMERTFTYLIGDDIVSFSDHTLYYNDVVISKMFFGKRQWDCLIYDTKFYDNGHSLGDVADVLRLYLAEFAKAMEYIVTYTSIPIDEFVYDPNTSEFERV